MDILKVMEVEGKPDFSTNSLGLSWGKVFYLQISKAQIAAWISPALLVKQFCNSQSSLHFNIVEGLGKVLKL